MTREEYINILEIDKAELTKENEQLKANYERLYNENCKLIEEHNITDINLLDENYELQQKYLNAVVGYKTTMAEKEQLNSLVNSCQEEIRKLKKQLEEKEREFISYLEDEIKIYENDIRNFKKDYEVYFSLINDSRVSKAKMEEILQKYKSIIGVSDEKEN